MRTKIYMLCIKPEVFAVLVRIGKPATVTNSLSGKQLKFLR